nr:hypothetical protein [Tanacetum cinerariifolium]
MTSLAEKAIFRVLTIIHRCWRRIFEENGVTRLKKYSELSTTEVIQADCDVKATNIILQGLSLVVYALVSTHKVAKELWERIQMLMQETSLTKKERECKLHTTNINFNHKYLHSSLLSMEHRIILLIFQKGDDPIDAINHMMSFLTAVVTSWYPATNNQLRTSSNPRQQATVNNERLTIQPIQGRQNSMNTGSSRPYTSGSSGTSRKQRVIMCYNCKGEGHMSKQCTKPKRKRDEEWFKDKVLLVQAQANRQVLQEEELEFLADPRIIALMANLSHYGSDNLVENSSSPALQDDLILFVIEQLKTQVVNCTKINHDNKNVNEILTVELERYKNQVKILKEQNNVDKASASCAQSFEIENLKHTLSEHLKEKESLEQKVNLLKNDFQKEESQNIDKELALEKQNPCYLKRAQQLKPKLYDGSVIQKTDAIVIHDSKETLMLEDENTDLSTEQAFWSHYSVQSKEPNLSSSITIVEVPKELPKISMVNSSLKRLKFYLASFDMVVKERTTATAITEGTCRFEHTNACFRDEIIPFVKALKELYNSFDQFLIDELTKVQNVFNQMEQAVEQHCVEKNKFQDKMKNVLKDNERLLEQAISVDIVNIVVHDHVNAAYKTMNVCERCVIIETELQKDFIKKEYYDTLFKKNFSKLQGNTVVTEAITLHPIDPELLKIDVAALAPKLRNNRTAHTDYLRHTQEEIATLSGSQPQGNTKKDRIQQTPNKAKKNKLEDHPRTVRPSLNKKKSVVDTKVISSVTNSKSNVNSNQKCATCNGCLFSDNHDSCVIQNVLWYLDFGCSKHMTEDRSQLINFVQKFLGTVKFGNDHVEKMMGYDLEVAFRQHTCFIHNLDGVDLLTGSRGNNLYTLSLQDMMASSPICLLSKVSKTKSWLWHRRLSHLNFGAINHLARQGLVRGLPKLKFEKNHLFSACAMGKSKKKSHKPK